MPRKHISSARAGTRAVDSSASAHSAAFCGTMRGCAGSVYWKELLRTSPHIAAIMLTTTVADTASRAV